MVVSGVDGWKDGRMGDGIWVLMLRGQVIHEYEPNDVLVQAVWRAFP